MTQREAENLEKWYLCSDCWGKLVPDRKPGTQEWSVRCYTPDCPCSGYVSKRYVEQRESKAHAEAVQARVSLAEAAPWLRKSERQALKEMGFGTGSNRQ